MDCRRARLAGGLAGWPVTHLALASFAPADFGLLALRLLTGSFLMWGTVDNISSAERMAEFVGFLGQSGFIMPELMAPLSVYTQFICGALVS